MRDTIIDEVRKTRDEYAIQFNYDLHAMCLDLRREQNLDGAPAVSFSTKPIRHELAQQSQVLEQAARSELFRADDLHPRGDVG